MPYDNSLIRNFSIIAHIDHGKSTVSDRIIQICGGLQDREMTEQVLDSMDIEKERGITIKSQTVRLKYKSKNDRGKSEGRCCGTGGNSLRGRTGEGGRTEGIDF